MSRRRRQRFASCDGPPFCVGDGGSTAAGCSSARHSSARCGPRLLLPPFAHSKEQLEHGVCAGQPLEPLRPRAPLLLRALVRVAFQSFAHVAPAHLPHDQCRGPLVVQAKIPQRGPGLFGGILAPLRTTSSSITVDLNCIARNSQFSSVWHTAALTGRIVTASRLVDRTPATARIERLPLLGEACAHWPLAAEPAHCHDRRGRKRRSGDGGRRRGEHGGVQFRDEPLELGVDLKLELRIGLHVDIAALR
mmetsp:Transcript_113423/g.360584  ORF Transcript_113423/g.360584 Transcript_113423/m.360584 type:complete len:249 (+) Transcript_113423:339-1085(+)